MPLFFFGFHHWILVDLWECFVIVLRANSRLNGFLFLLNCHWRKLERQIKRSCFAHRNKTNSIKLSFQSLFMRPKMSMFYFSALRFVERLNRDYIACDLFGNCTVRERESNKWRHNVSASCTSHTHTHTPSQPNRIESNWMESHSQYSP